MIEVGEYIRTESGYIGKVTEILSGAVAPRAQTERKAVSTLMITKHSKDIIDLIEVGDIVCIKDSLYDNEYKSEVFEDYNNMLCINNFEEDEILELRKNIQDKQIELVSILTHEMYEQNCYKVGGENE